LTPYHPGPVFQRGFPNRRAGADSRVVEQQIGASECVKRLSGERINRLRLRYVHGHADNITRASSQLVARLRERVLLDIRQHDVHSFRAGFRGQGLAYPARCASHYSRLSL
jgi:hypothetical protein